MLKIVLFLAILGCFSLSSTTFGLFSEKLGTDFFNFSLKLYEKDDNEFFISIGPSIALPTNLGVGWKHYYKNNNKKIIPFSCLSIFERYSNKMAITNGSAIREDNCIGLSGGISLRPFERDVYINMGLFTSYDFRNKPMTLPFINIEFYIFSKSPLFGNIRRL